MNDKKIIDKEKKKDYIRKLLEQFFEVCKRRGYSKKQCADIAGVKFTAIYRWLRNESLPVSNSIIERIENFLKEKLVQ